MKLSHIAVMDLTLILIKRAYLLSSSFVSQVHV